jgi:hypothetical protein
MSCRACADKGIIRLNWADAPDDFAVCLCLAGLSMRATTNQRRTVPARWRVWCAREQVDPAKVFMVEDVLTPEELAERGLSKPRSTAQSREAALLAAGKGKT